MKDQLLTRDKFRQSVFEHDNYKCVICGNIAVDAHHIIERRLFSDGGYYLSNGASLCASCHILAERTNLTVEEIRVAAGIKNIILPPQLYSDYSYDKWGNIIQADETRLRGELFYDESVQKILGEGGVLDLFVDYVKYPRTHHIPWSPGITNDDRIMESLDGFDDKNGVVVTVKMDGENTTLYRDYVHARSLEYTPHPSRNRVKAIWANIAHDIPDGWRICGENLYAKHSIHYTHLKDYFLVFSIWNERNECLSWDDTVQWCALLGLKMVPEQMRGMWVDVEPALRARHEYEPIPVFEDEDEREGYVVRVARQFKYSEFRRVVGKYVRANHVQTHGHWMRSAVIPNKLEESEDRK